MVTSTMPSSHAARGALPIVQILPSLQHGDAITNHGLHLDRQLVRAGYETHLYARFLEPGFTAVGEADGAYLPWLTKPHLLIYHYALQCDNAILYRASRAAKMLIYHNITPEGFFTDYSPALARDCVLGRLDLPTLAGCDLAVADSEYNAQELVSNGFDGRRIEILAPSPQLAALDATIPSPTILERYADRSMQNLLFVGRVTPNKAHEDVIKAFALYHRHYNPRSRLFLVGSRFLPLYDQRLLRLAVALGVGEAVVFTGRVTLPELRAYYTLADLYLCLSRHEGFCAPLAEAMHLGVPIVARPTTAIPETLGDGGLLIDGGHGEFAEAIGRVLGDSALRARMIAAGRAQALNYMSEPLEARFATIMDRFLDLGRGEDAEETGPTGTRRAGA